MDAKKLDKHIRLARVEADLTQTDLANKIHAKQKSLPRYETGALEKPDDPMVSELHAIREKHYQQTKPAPATERNRLVRFLSSYGYRLVPTKRGTRKLVRSSK